MKYFWRVGMKFDGKTKYYHFESWDDVVTFIDEQAGKDAEHISIAKQKMFTLEEK